MRHQKHGRILSRRVNHRKALLANLASSLILHGRIKTTEPKAKEVRPFIERMVTFARRGDLHARRIVLSRIRDAEAVKKLFGEIGPKFADRNGKYTRILKLGFRHGDNSPMSYIEFVGQDDEVKKKPVKRKKAGTRGKAGAKAPETAQAQETAEVIETAEAQESEGAQAEAAPSEGAAEPSAVEKKKPAEKKKKEKKTGEKAGE